MNTHTLNQILAVAPTTLGELADKAPGMFTAFEAVALTAAVLSFAWVGFQIVKKYTGGAIAGNKAQEDE